MPIKRCPLFIVAQLLPRSLGGKSSVATKTHSEEQKSNSKGQQALAYHVGLCTKNARVHRFL
ncbi:hypothetical protein [Pseudoalteromonas piscicida]|uniref:hypothetical protein n=1 Tax=Pseudoalteromonas piscicida TaxID=43662 RepID=UPI0009E4AD0F